jgi:hypothetical protein
VFLSKKGWEEAMAKLVWVGRNNNNRGGSSSKAYTISRHGRKVETGFGRIDVIAGKYYWRGRHRTWDEWLFRTAREALDWAKQQLARKMAKVYDHLPRMVRLRPPPRKSTAS